MGPLAKEVAVPPLVSRLTHWVNAIAIIIMIRSGWRIYNASPFFPFMFPNWLTMGDWLGGALAIHFAMMWVLAVSMLVYLCHGLATGGLRRRLLPIAGRAIGGHQNRAYARKRATDFGGEIEARFTSNPHITDNELDFVRGNQLDCVVVLTGGR